jgi:hypothetical protein
MPPFFAAQLEPLKPKKRYLAFAGRAPLSRENACIGCAPGLVPYPDQGLFVIYSRVEKLAHH